MFKSTLAVASIAGFVGWWWLRRKRKSGVYIGVDLGGTSIKAGLVSEAGYVLQSSEQLIEDRSFHAVCVAIVDLCCSILREQGTNWDQVSGIGVVMPGMVDTKTGVTVVVANFPSWPKNAPFATTLRDLCGVLPVVDNDANVALLAEVWQGAAKGHENAVMITLGTGVGGAMISGGRLLRGRGNMAGEIGHAILKIGGRYSANTGVHGIVEEYVSARAVGSIGQERAAPGSKLASLGSKLTCKDVFDIAAKGDEVACEIVDETADLLAVLCINLTRFMDPSVIILTGGMTAAGDVLLEKIKLRFLHHNWTLDSPTCLIQYANLGTKAGIVGAAFLCHPAAHKIVF